MQEDVWFLLLLPACKNQLVGSVEVERLCRVECASDLRSQPERDLCVAETIACEADCIDLLDRQGRLCVDCMQDSGIDGPFVIEEDGEQVCDPGLVSRGSCSGICPVF